MTVKFAVGDTVIHVVPSYRRGLANITRRTVVKVGRKYAYVDDPSYRGDEKPFDKYTGCEHRSDGYTNHLESIWVPADWEAQERRGKVLADLKEAGIVFKEYGEPPYGTETLEKLLTVVQASLDSKRTVAVL